MAHTIAFNADCGNGKSCFKALADLGPVYVIILSEAVKYVSDHEDNLQLKKSCKNLSKIVSQDYGIKWNDCYAWAIDSKSSKSIHELMDYLAGIGPFYKNEE